MRHHAEATSTRKHFTRGLLVVSEGEPIDIMAGNAMAGSQAGMHGAGAESYISSVSCRQRDCETEPGMGF